MREAQMAATMQVLAFNVDSSPGGEFYTCKDS